MSSSSRFLTPQGQRAADFEQTLRASQYEKLNWDSSGASQTPYRDNGILTPTLALMHQLTAETLAYASYVESLQQGAIVPSLPVYTNAGQMLDPLLSKQWELGIKQAGERWSATAALFRVSKTTEYDRSCGMDCLTLVQDGESRFQGLELGAAAHLTSNWSLDGNLMWLDSEYVSGEAAIVGNRIAGAPRWVATSQLTYRVPQVTDLQLYLAGKYTGKTALRADNSLDVDGYSLASLGAAYDTVLGRQPITWRANINNLFNQQYWLYQYSNYIKAGEPRSLSLNATLHF